MIDSNNRMMIQIIEFKQYDSKNDDLNNRMI